MKSQIIIFVFSVLISIINCSPAVPESDDQLLFENEPLYESWVQLPLVYQSIMSSSDLLQDQDQEPAIHRVRRQNQVSVGAEHSRRGGTNVNVDAQARLWESKNGRSTLDANANYNRQYGGQGGTGRPNYGGGLNFRHRF